MKFTVREMIEQDIEPIYQFMKQPEIAHLTDHPVIPFDAFYKNHQLYVEGYAIDLKIFIILIDDVIIGKMELGYDLTNRTGQFEIVIGNKQFWGTGIAEKALGVLLSYGFNNLGLNKLTCEVMAYNERSIHFMQKMGLQVDGILREDRLVNGQYVNVFLFSILKNEIEGAIL